MSFQPTYPYDDLPLLPPKLDWRDPQYLDTLLQARTELGVLDGLSFSVPNPALLLSPAILKECVASSNIENIHTTLLDVLESQLFPEEERRAPDKEALRYSDAIHWGAEQVKNLALSTRLILGVENKLIPNRQEGYRKQQNKISNSTSKEILYTPPSAPEVPRLISNWENFVNGKDDGIDPLVKCAIAHYQFEAIHPFEDGNGRTGRILMVLQLMEYGLLHWPILYISGYINANRSEYYRLLRAVTSDGKWGDFIAFMLKGFHHQAKKTKKTLIEIMALLLKMKEEIKAKHRKIYSADLVEALFEYPIINPVKLGGEIGVHYVTASSRLHALAEAGVLKSKKHGKYQLFINERLLQLLRK